MKTAAPVFDVQWKDLCTLTTREVIMEFFLPWPWLFLSLYCYQRGFWIPGLLCAFYLFLTGLRQSHGAQHYTLGLPRWIQDIILLTLSVVMLGSMHAVQISHLHHHRHCLDEDDTEGFTAKLPWWQAILLGPLFLVRMHGTALQLGSKVKRRWIVCEILLVLGIIAYGISDLSPLWMKIHCSVMFTGEFLTGFFAVWTVHHDCDEHPLKSRTQRGRWINFILYDMFYHTEHHLFPLVPTCHLKKLADRLDETTSLLTEKQVLGMTSSTKAFGNQYLSC